MSIQISVEITVSDIVGTLGGAAKTAALCNVGPCAVHVWRKKNEIPAWHYPAIAKALEASGYGPNEKRLLTLFPRKPDARRKTLKTTQPDRLRKFAERRAEIIAQYDRGVPVRGLAETYGVSRARVYQIIASVRKGVVRTAPSMLPKLLLSSPPPDFVVSPSGTAWRRHT